MFYEIVNLPNSDMLDVDEYEMDFIYDSCDLLHDRWIERYRLNECKQRCLGLSPISKFAPKPYQGM